MPFPADINAVKNFFSRNTFWDIEEDKTLLLLVIVLIVSSIRRFYNIDTYSLWSDELWGVVACSQGSWWAMIENLIHSDSHPPGYQTLLYGWMQLFGTSDFSIRAPSAIAGILGIFWTYELGRRHFSAITGLVAAATLAGSYQAVFYSQEARSYAFLMCVAPAFASYYLDLFIQGLPERKTAALRGFWITATALLYLHYVGAIIVGCAAGVWLYHWIRRGCHRENITLALQAFALPALLYSPWLPVMYHHLVDAPDAWSTPVADMQRIIDTYRFLLGPDNTRFYASVALTAMLFSLQHLGFIKRRMDLTNAELRKKIDSWTFLMLLSILPVIVFALQSHLGTSAYTFRHFTYLIPLFAVMLACLPASIAGMIHSQKWKIRYVIFACLTSSAANTYYNIKSGLYDHYWKEDYRQAVDIVEHDQRFMNSGEQKLVVTNSPFFDHYLKQSHLGTKTTFALTDPAQIPEMEALLKSSQATRFYYLEVSNAKSTPVMEALNARYQSRCFSRLNKVNVGKFLLVQAPDDQSALAELHDCPLKRSVRPQGIQHN